MISSSVKALRERFGYFVEHLPGDSPGFVAVLANLWNIRRRFSGVCCRFCVVWKHLPEISLLAIFFARYLAFVYEF